MDLKPSVGSHSKPSFTAAPQGLLGGGILTAVYFVLRHFRVAPAATWIVVLSAVAVVATVAWAYRASRSGRHHWTDDVRASA